MIDPIVATTTGQVLGVREGGVTVFRGVPYAAAPVGALRFAVPQPYPAWEGLRDATRPGPNTPQRMRAFPGLDLAPVIGEGWRRGDDYLNATIWTADCEGKAPVMVWIHGGGSADAAVQAGTAFARLGVVLISITYRMGVDGFTAIPGAPTNLGLRDQIAALKWVSAHATAFGGDPANITVFGESAGAMSIADLVASPLAQGLFQKAIIQSGHGSMVRPVKVAERLAVKLAKVMGVSPDLEGFRRADIEQSLDAMEKAQSPTFRVDLRDDNGREAAGGLSKFLPVYGDDVLPDPPLEALGKGVGADIQVLIGANAEEMNLYFVPTGVRDKANPLLAWLVLRRALPRAWAVLKAYGMGAKGAKAGDVLARAMGDLVFRYPTRQFAEAHQGRTHLYDFAWRSPACNGQLGASHGMDLPFVFNTLACCTGPQGLVGEAPPQALADRIQAIWAEFAKTGALPWPEYRPDTRLVYALEAGTVDADPDMPIAPFIA